jgi:hypothetical protein
VYLGGLIKSIQNFDSKTYWIIAISELRRHEDNIKTAFTETYCDMN